jgi:hypothetical protein
MALRAAIERSVPEGTTDLIEELGGPIMLSQRKDDRLFSLATVLQLREKERSLTTIVPNR